LLLFLSGAPITGAVVVVVAINGVQSLLEYYRIGVSRKRGR